MHLIIIVKELEIVSTNDENLYNMYKLLKHVFSKRQFNKCSIDDVCNKMELSSSRYYNKTIIENQLYILVSLKNHKTRISVNSYKVNKRYKKLSDIHYVILMRTYFHNV